MLCSMLSTFVLTADMAAVFSSTLVFTVSMVARISPSNVLNAELKHSVKVFLRVTEIADSWGGGGWDVEGGSAERMDEWMEVRDESVGV